MKKERHVHGQLLFIMRVSCLYLFSVIAFFGMAHAADGNAQVLERKVSVRLENVSLREALQKIESVSDVKFLYQPQIIAASEKVNLTFTDERLADVLKKLLDPLAIRFESEGNQIVLMKQPRGALEVEPGPQDNKQPFEVQISGTITDDLGQPLPGVNILVKGTTLGTTSDAEGKFSLSVADENSVLVFTFIGFLSQEVQVGQRTNLSVQMMPDVTSLSEIVVVGYGEIKKSDVTGSLSSVKGEELNAYPSNNMMQSLSGRATGVQVSQTTGAPGASISVRVRGTNSVQGSNEPLYVVDGFPYSSNPTLLNNSDIESIEILKDASATAIYGSRGANGVVLITTKRGKAGKTTVDYDGYYGFQKIRKKIDMMNAQEYAQFYNEQAANDGLAPHFTQDQINGFGKGTDWQDVALRTAPIQNHSITVNGGGESTKFSISGSNFNQSGIIIGSDYVRNSLRANISTDISKKFKLDLSTILSRIDSDRKNSGKGNRGGSLISAMLSGYPTFSPYNADGTYTNLSTAYSWGSNVITNPLNFIEQQSDFIRSNKVLANGAVTYKVLDGLSIKISGGIENTDDRNDLYTTKKYVNSTGSATINTQQATSVLNENTISYVKEFNNHSISAVAGFTYQNYKATQLNTSASGFVSDVQQSYDIGAGATQGVPFSSFTEWTLLSYLARVNYGFKGKYLATVSFRADGSSRYTDGQKWGSFPSASLAWRVSEEEFMQNIRVISNLKLRGGYGETGSTAIDPYSTLNQLTSGKAVFGDALTTYYAPTNRLAGPLKWETTAQTDIGLDLGLFQNRVNFSADFYVKNTRDLLNTVPLASSLGYSYTIQNVGKTQNKGIELALGGVALEGPFRWDLSANISFNRNKVVKLYGGNDVLGAPIDISVVNDNINILREGQPIGSFFGYVEKGYDNTGRIVYEDFNGNGTRDIGDKRIIGNPNPNFVYGFNSTMSYKNFELNIFIQGTQGNDIFNLSAVNQTLDYGQALNMPRDVYENHWTPENPTAKYPVISRTSQTQVSNRFVEDGSYLRVKNIQLSYNLPVSVLELHWLRKAQIYVSGQNLLTLTGYSWYDPEVNSYGGVSGANSIQLGIDHYSYPTAKTMTVGLRLGF
ncbi:TonB-linked outer membrane protein, SusC/RagA family [Chryseolinea serpens]|uniref:TonB-linked outer membrane protein, SusC/RagA family n=1 Tax=Chryseolinea serpens TaxID=947013 RepID=A0A1M5WQD6_9BACT|nr:TonB-dependent receptor [Chryseolinea serpens]SHH89718.1 TonB-linked outer membrane protein, SusC/RagA family [Chryseolinea serpens]